MELTTIDQPREDTVKFEIPGGYTLSHFESFGEELDEDYTLRSTIQVATEDLYENFNPAKELGLLETILKPWESFVRSCGIAYDSMQRTKDDLDIFDEVDGRVRSSHRVYDTNNTVNTDKRPDYMICYVEEEQSRQIYAIPRQARFFRNELEIADSITEHLEEFKQNL